MLASNTYVRWVFSENFSDNEIDYKDDRDWKFVLDIWTILQCGNSPWENGRQLIQGIPQILSSEI